MSDNKDTITQDDGQDPSREAVLKKIKEITQICPGRSFIFRGESKKYGEISSGLYRYYCMPREEDKREDDKRKEHRRKEDRQAAELKKNDPRIKPEYFPTLEMMRTIIEKAKEHFEEGKSSIGMLTELQHQGGKTALIDFTRNIHIALYFACNNHPDEDGWFFGIDEKKLENLNNDKFKSQILKPSEEKAGFGDGKEKIYCINPIGKEPRTVFQSSVFVFPVRGFLEKGEFHPIKIETALKKSMLEYLRTYHGIEEKTIYNDLHGFIQRELSDSYIHFYRGLSLYEEGDYPQAITEYGKALEINPQLFEAYSNKGAVKAALGNHKEAIKDYDKALKINPRYAGAYNKRGIARRKLGQHEEAIQDFDKALEINPKHAAAYNNRGVARGVLGQYEEAIKDCDKALAIDPRYAAVYTVYNNRGIARGVLRQYGNAIQDFDKALEINPQYAEAYNNRGIMRIVLGQHEEAIEDFDKVLEINPKHAEAYHNRGVVRRALGQLKEAIQDFEKALELYRKAGDDDQVKAIEETLKQLKERQQDASAKEDL